MLSQISRVSYAYNSILEAAGSPGYFFDCLTVVDGETVVDVHKQFRTREELFAEMEKVLPVLEQADLDYYGNHNYTDSEGIE